MSFPTVNEWACGCRLITQDGVGNLHPCSDDCPVIEALTKQARKEGAEVLGCPTCAKLPPGVPCGAHGDDPSRN